MPNLHSESFGVAEKASWLASAHGIWNGRTVRLLVSAFTDEYRPDGQFLSAGTPLQENNDGLHVPYAGTGRFAGFLLTDQSVVNTDETINVPLLDHGRVNVDKLPLDFTVPAPGNDDTTFVYLNAAARDSGGGNGGEG
ncbi:MAG TPA: hypothetical protein H9871_02095 [Candidatus Nesterenkonia stercoripullorum]|uniref:Uncharacterized protein n=1 Tax=Candidatus Nesterenkonia stercoripullorum TaxID=2838701 RepID=A0A9D1S0L1_9MICC|nr:hypothetical protein [Candidatus Nesterenkonia stercoripullorum]